MSDTRGQQSLRTRPVPLGIDVLLSIANQVKQAATADYKLPAGTTMSRTLIGSHVHNNIVHAETWGHDEETIRFYLERAVDKLPAELKAFVKPERKLLRQNGEPWKKVIGPWLFNYALGLSGGLMSPEKGDGFFGEAEVEAMRQRYLFLFAVREILKAISLATPLDKASSLREVTLLQKATARDQAKRNLNLLHTYLPRSPGDALPALSPVIPQVKNLQSTLYISDEETRDGTHKLGVSHPVLFKVLEGVEAERIRECPICEKLFWAGRLDQAACSPRCSNVHRGRIWRSNYQEKYKRQRKQRANGPKRKRPTRNGTRARSYEKRQRRKEGA